MAARREDVGVKAGFLFFKMGDNIIWLYVDRIDTLEKKRKKIKHDIEGEIAAAKCLSELEEMGSRAQMEILLAFEEGETL